MKPVKPFDRQTKTSNQISNMAAHGLNYLRTVNLKLETSQLNPLGYLGYNGMIYKRDNKYSGEDWFFSTKWGSIQPAEVQKLITNKNSSIWFIHESGPFDVITHHTINGYSPKIYRNVKYGFDRVSIEMKEGFKNHLGEFLKQQTKEYKTDIKSNILNIEHHGFLYKTSTNLSCEEDESIERIKPTEYKDRWRYKDKRVFLNCKLVESKELRSFIEVLLLSVFCKVCHFYNKDKKVISVKRNFDFIDLDYYDYWKSQLEYDDEREGDFSPILYQRKSYFHWDFCEDENYLKWQREFKMNKKT